MKLCSSNNHYTTASLVADDKEIKEQTHILKHIRELFETLFKTREQKTATEIEKRFSNVDIPKGKLFEEDLTKYLYNYLKNMQNDKSLSNGGLTIEFCDTFCNELKEIFVEAVSEVKEKGH